MHRSPLSVLVILAALAACSTHDAPAADELLSQDSTLVARLAVKQAPPQVALPDACGAVTTARPAVANASLAEQLARQGYDAEALGRLQEARSLLHRATELDATNESAAYHLGRTNEALGDRAAAITAYCQFLALTPTTAESADARQRVAQLAQPAPQPAPQVATGDRETTPARRARTTGRRVTRRRATVARSVATSSRARVVHTASAAAPATDAAPSSPAPIASAPGVESAAERTTAAGDVVASTGQEPTAAQPSTASRTSRGGLSRTQRAGIGAAAGAMIGAATGRSVKGAVIGAAAGGVLGTVLGGRSGLQGRGIRP